MKKKLKPRNRQVLELVSHGLKREDIAQEMGIPIGTVDNRLKVARKAFGAETNAQAVAIAIREKEIK